MVLRPPRAAELVVRRRGARRRRRRIMVRTLSLLLIIAFGLPAARPAPILKEPEKGALYLASKVGDKLEYEETVSGVRKEDERWVTAVDKHRGLVIVSFSFSFKKDESSD